MPDRPHLSVKPKASSAVSMRHAWVKRAALSLLAIATLFSSTAAHAVAAPYFAGAQTALASAGTFGSSVGITVDASGNLYVTNGGNIIYEIPSGCSSPSCSTKLGGTFSFGTLVGLAVDSAENVYVADGAAAVAYEINRACINGVNDNTCVTPLGGGFSQPNGIGVDAAGDVFVSDLGNSRVIEMTPNCPDSTCVTVLANHANNGITSPSGIALDAAGDLFFGDFNGNIYEMPFSGGYSAVNTLTSGFTDPEDVAVDGSGNLYVVSFVSNTTVQEILASGGSIPASPTMHSLGSGFNDPRGITIDGNGNLFIADTGNQLLQEVQPYIANLGTIALPAATTTTVNFAFPSTNREIGAPIVLPAFPPLIATTNEFANAGTGTCTSGSSFGTGDASATCTVNVTFTPAYPGQRAGIVQLMDMSANILASVNVYGTGLASQIAIAPGVINTIVGSSTTTGGVTTGTVCASPGGTPPTCGDGGPPTSAQLNNPTGVTLDALGNLYIVDQNDFEVREADTSGAINTVAGNGTACDPSTTPTPGCGDGGPATSAEFELPYSVAVDGAGNIFVSDFSAATVREVVAATGNILTVAGVGDGSTCDTSVNVVCGNGGAATGPTLVDPAGITLDGLGNLYIADQFTGTVRKVSLASGIITTVAGGGATPATCPGSTDAIGDGCLATNAILTASSAVAVDAAGNLYIAEQSPDSDVRKVTAATGIITIYAGGGTGTCSTATDPLGDGCPAIDAELDNPGGLSLDAGGALYIADDLNIIHKVDTAGNIIAVGGDGTNGYAGDGFSATGSSTFLAAPEDAAVDPTGNIYIADTGNSVIREVNVSQAAPVVFNVSTAVGTQDTSEGVPFLAVYNTGNTALIFPGGGGSGAGSVNPVISGISALPDFTVDTAAPPPCNLGSGSADYSLVAGGNCTFGFDFFPQSTGSLSDLLVFTDNTFNAPGTTQVITLEGTGVPPVTFITTSPLTDAVAGAPYSLSISVSGGDGTFTSPGSIAILSGALPNGLSMDSNGNITGTATAVGTFNFTVMATDTSTPNPITNEMAYALTVDPPVIVMTPGPGLIGTGAVDGVTYPGGITFSASGGNGTYTYSITGSSSLPAGDISGPPPGMSIDSGSGILSGTPIGAGTYAFNVVASDQTTGSAAPYSGSQAYTFTVTAPTIKLSPSSLTTAVLPDGADDGVTVYSQTISTTGSTGGVAPFTYGITGGALPPGFSLNPSCVPSPGCTNPTGVITGTTTSIGTYSFTITATDSSSGTGAPYSGSQTYSITIDAGAAVQFTVTGPASAFTGASTPFTVTALDSSNNVATGYTGTFQLSSSDPNANLGAAASSATLTSGTGIFNVAFATGGGQLLTATDTSNSTITGVGSLLVVPTDIWVVNSDGSLSELYENGIAQSDTGLSTNAPISGAGSAAVAFDGSGNVWSASSSGIVEYNQPGALQSTVTGGGISSPAALAVDGFGDIWIANGNGSVSEIRNGGTISPSGGFVGGGLSGSNGIAVDISGNVWVSNSGNNSVTEIVGGAPPVQPLATGTEANTLGQRP